MKTVLDLTHIEAKEFFLNEKSYFSVDLPEYFTFQSLLNRVDKKLNGKELKSVGSSVKIRDVEKVNYSFFNNKDGKFAYRPIELIHPAVYVSLVTKITSKEHWETIQKVFKNFKNNPNISCNSIPVSDDDEQPNKQSQVYEWWEKVEQESLKLAIKYNHVLHLDITDCYGSIYTHSIVWAIHGKQTGKNSDSRRDDSLIGNVIDWHIQDMSYAQTNGIPQGSVLMDFIAEIVLGYGDLLLSERLENLSVYDYKIIRYRDDYRIFSSSSEHSNLIAKELSEVLSGLNFRINSSKTISSNDLVLGSLKPDKIHWIYNKRKTENIQKWLLQLYVIGNKFPDSGTLYKELKNFLEWLEKREKIKEEGTGDSKDKKKIKQPEVLISILTNIAYNNPRTYPLVVGAISFLIVKIKEAEKQEEILNDIINKFKQIPNTDYLEVWLQRLTCKIVPTINFQSELSCYIGQSRLSPLWNSSWLNSSLEKLIDETPIINYKVLDEMGIVFSEKETNSLGQSDKCFS